VQVIPLLYLVSQTLENLCICENQHCECSHYSRVRKDKAKLVVAHDEVNHWEQNGHNPHHERDQQGPDRVELGSVNQRVRDGEIAL